jgi:hypothetical protein
MGSPHRRTGGTDLLARPPWAGDGTGRWVVRVADPVSQLEALADLRRRGVLSAEEFEGQKAKVLAQ